MAEMVYLDYAASTPADPRVVDVMTPLFGAGGDFANPSSGHTAGRRSSAHVERAAGQLAELLGCKEEQLVWTSGATESDNLAIVGAARYRADRGRHLITMPTEHKAVADVFHVLEKRGFEVSWLRPDDTGVLDPANLEAAIRPDTQLVSIMQVNNETGVIQDIEALGALCRERDVLFHVDAAQSVGKLPLALASLPVDLLSTTAHKVYGPKGIGALYIADRPGCHVEPLIYGGGQQGGRRPGTLAVPLIAGFGEAARIARCEMQENHEHLRSLRERLWSGIRDLDGIVRNGSDSHSFPGILNVSIEDVEGESLLLALEPLCVATGSACNSTSQEPSSVLRALGRSDLLAQSAIRFSFGRPTTSAEVDLAVARYREAVARLRDIAPGRAA
ncbi:MAG: aminotransferase class V-fold PLP-dependent enzyme [Gammaproteobacteria bacterium]|nr:aminotransferase class V-fold PLP-dependent enzyme [Gammaproteobacteria bacterium]MDH3904214.1 aminotransferase class V-fold PLP-dependent enzyme [Gammaproteobacteria bacterium]MDH3952787.1 aminotransferase class V-fold PLP-dependent enzyme [Gammaproteobacteria bacterium]MDH4003810.1 aminotransferase class V-fold PLP-dependent enzyme [Gammaproteobacteria bacterium]NCF58927.1 aminotransferase class V-fold PLP-dependent enzyme [Gammaproteobacteria bacterium]